AQSLLGETVALTTNFRTVPPVLDWINTVFATLITPQEDAQPDYQSLTPHRTFTTTPAALGSPAGTDGVPPADVPATTTTSDLSPEAGPTVPAGSARSGIAAPTPSGPIGRGDQLSLFGDGPDLSEEPNGSGPATGDQFAERPSSDPLDPAHPDRESTEDTGDSEASLATVTPIRPRLTIARMPSEASPSAAPADLSSASDPATHLSGTAELSSTAGPAHLSAPGASGLTAPADTFRPAGPAVTVLGAEPHDDLPRAQASVLREREAADVAAVVEQALREGWQIYDDKTSTWRPAGAGDIAVLVPARTSLPFLEEALDRVDIPYRAEASSLVYQTAEVRDLLACARALGDPSDQLALVTALRSPLFGCGDDDLFTWKRSGGSFTLTAPVPDSLLTHPVGEAIEWLRRTYYAARWMTPSEVLAKIVADRRMLEVAATGPRARDAWRRVRFVVDQARAWSEVEHGGLRSYLAWSAHQGEEASRVAEAVLPETDADAVRVMTIHAAKGLEFPIVILSGMTAAPNRQRGVQVLWPTDGGYAVKLKASVQTEDFDLVQPVDEQMDDYERRRLLYVAATRARDHLVVSLHRSGTRKHSSNAELLASGGGVEAADATLFTSPASESVSTGSQPPTEVTAPIARSEWEARVASARQASRRKSAQSASGLEGTGPDVALQGADPGVAKAPRDVELPPWSKGRYGTAIGRAVHGVMQVVDLGTGAGLDAAVSAQCLAEGVIEYADVVTALVRSALASDVVARAAAREHWRESYVGIPQPDGTVLEGFIDLIYREDDGTHVIVDYKTDAIPAAALDSRIAHYAPQLQAYTTMLPNPGRPILLFLAPTGALAQTL
ncbi:MAG TPA: 3'-5' exonuclease, partial [Kribbella sp.]|uniref:UvrD-helicase domain-containing protein n=1 Tax=Kribbella sp. TaxID=1871183 RepID=UPI002D7A0A88